MADTVVSENEILLNGVFFPVKRPVQKFLASIYPGKVVVGDTTRDSNPNASPLAISDWGGGVGLFKDTSVSPQDRPWFSTASLRYKSLTLPNLPVATAASGVSGSFTIGAIATLADEVYAAFGTSVRKYDNGADSWGSSLHTLPAVATDAISDIRIGGTVYLAFAHTGGYTYFDGATWTDDTTDTKYLEFWDDKLWGIDNTGLLWLASSIGTETTDAQLPLPDGYATALFQARNAAGDVILYAGTKVGLFSHDSANKKWVRVDGVQQPVHPDGSRGAIQWRDSAYIPAGLGITKFINGTNSAVVTVVGPDRDDGVPSGKGGTIRQLVSTHNDLIAVNDATTAFDQSTRTLFATRGAGNHHGVVLPPNTGFSSLLGWDDRGWEVKWLSGSTDRAITFCIVSNAYGKYRLWWGLGGIIYYMQIPSQIVNPNEISDLPYASSAEHETSWYNIGQMEVDKLGLQLKGDTLDLSATETVIISWAINLIESFTALTTITTDGITTFTLPTTANPVGTGFEWIKFKVNLARGSTNTLTPQLVNLTLVYRKKLPVKWGFNVVLDLAKENSHGDQPEILRAAAETAIASTTLVPFLFRDDETGGSTFYVDVGPSAEFQHTGHDQRGEMQLTLTER